MVTLSGNLHYEVDHAYIHVFTPTEPKLSAPAVPPKPQHYSAPSWQSATVHHPKPPTDGYERVVQMTKEKSSTLGMCDWLYTKLS